MVKLTKVVSDDVYENINSYVETNKVIVNDYEAMVNLILRMTKDGYCFTMDRDILRDAMESLTYMYAPDDDMNKDRLVQQLVDEDEEEDDSSEEGCEDFGNMDLMKMMQMMGGMGGPGGPDGPGGPCGPGGPLFYYSRMAPHAWWWTSPLGSFGGLAHRGGLVHAPKT